MIRSALLVVSAVSLLGCHVLDGGPEVSETRTVEAFTRLRIDDGIPAKWSPGAPQVTLHAPQKVVENLEAVVKDGQLIVRLKPGVIVNSFDQGTEVLVTGAQPTALEATGGSELGATGLDASPLRVNASGGSRVTLAGRAADLRLGVSGASKVSALQLAAEVVGVDVSGASTAEVSASTTVEGSVSGASRVVVFGAADVTHVSTTGASSLSHAAQ